MISSGILPIDERIGGVLPGRMHIVTGGPGSGKSALALHFAWAALRQRECAVILIDGRPEDLKSLARHLGMDLDAQQRAGNLLLLRYREEFATRFAFAANPEAVSEHLRRFVGPASPARIVVDSFVPFLADGAALGTGSGALVRFLHGSGATALATFPLDLEHGYDTRIAPVVQEAAAIFRVARMSGGTHRLDAVATRYASIGTRAEFAIERGRGIVASPRASHGGELGAEHPVVVDAPLLLGGTGAPVTTRT